MKKQWTDEEGRGNPWVKYGVTLVRAFEIARGNVPHDEPVPEDSPYWS